MKTMQNFKILMAMLSITAVIASCSKKDDNVTKDDTGTNNNTNSGLPAEGSMKGTIDGKSVEMRYTVAYNYLGLSSSTEKVFTISGITSDGKSSVTLLFYNTDLAVKDYSFGLDDSFTTGVEISYIDGNTPSSINGTSSSYTPYQGNLLLSNQALSGKLTITAFTNNVSVAGVINAEVQNIDKTKTILLTNIIFSATIYKDENSIPKN